MENIPIIHLGSRYNSFAAHFAMSLDNSMPIEIKRHRAAIVRKDLSRPVRLAVSSEVLTKEDTFFDYGCGRGEDVDILSREEFNTRGWDPHYFAENVVEAADVVNFGYVLNVIEDKKERRETLQMAWTLAKKVLIVSAQVSVGESTKKQLSYKDGFITARNTFQKYFEQQELKAYIDTSLGVESVPAGLGIYFVFRDETRAEAFRASRFRSATTSSRVKIDPKRFNDYLPILQPLIDFITERGRLPMKEELPEEDLIAKDFRTIKRAFSYIKLATDQEENWQKIFNERREDMLVYLALSRFERRPNFKALPKTIQYDIKAFFRNYKRSCELADQLLFSLGTEGEIARACRESAIGKLVGGALYVHISALTELDPMLRVFEGCASRTFGRLENVTILKFRSDKPKVSYLYYPDFDANPHPSLHSSMLADLKGLQVKYRDYTSSDNPPILHRKETFVSSDYPNYKKFKRLTKAEEKAGLLDDPAVIGTRNRWEERLSAFNVKIRSHKLINKHENIDPLSGK